MKKMILSLTIMAVFLAFPTVAHAAEMLEKDYIKAEIWSEIWLGKSDDGTEDNFYSFQLIDNQWNMLDENGGIVDIFPIFSTLDENEENKNHTLADDDNGNENSAVGIAGNRTEKPSESFDNTNSKVSADSTERATDSVSERSENSAVPIVVGCIAVVGIGVGGAILYKKRK